MAKKAPLPDAEAKSIGRPDDEPVLGITMAAASLIMPLVVQATTFGEFDTAEVGVLTASTGD